MKPETTYALIVAGGSGTRMQNTLPKQFLLLGGRPMLMLTLEKFSATNIILVLPEAHIPYWNSLCSQYGFLVPHKVVCGGDTRSESVMNGLQLVPDDALVAIHDGVRPLLSTRMIEDGFRTAEVEGNAIPVVPLTDSIRIIEPNGSKAVDRELYRLVQTPQIFRAEEIKTAYRLCGQTAYTDDASVLEAAGKLLHLYQGEPSNIKITRPADLIYAEAFLNSQNQ